MMRKHGSKLLLSAVVGVGLLAPVAVRAADDAPKIDFVKQVRPILAESCYKCHGAEKTKGGLRLDSPEAITKGGKDGKAIEKGAPETSPLFLRLVLPKGHDDIMPSEGDPLPREKTDLIGQWIMQGANFGDWKGDATAAASGAGAPAPLPQVAAADAGALDKLRQGGARALPLAQGVNLLDVGFSSGGEVADAQLALLVPVATQVYELNLAGSKVTDAGLEQVGKLANLRRLHLEKTAVTDAGLAHLKNLANLEYLNLYGTAVTDAGLANLAGMKNLRSLYLWQTKVTPDGAAALKKSLPTVNVNRGEDLTVAPPPGTAVVVAAPAGAKPVNLKCPVSGKDVDPKKPILLFEGKAVGFCCDMCPEAFKKEPTKFAANIKLDGPGAPQPAAAEAGKLDGEGYVREWLVLAPVPFNPGATGPSELDREVVPSEAGLKPKEGDKVTVAGKELAWKKAQAKDYFFDVNAIIGTPTPQGAAYAVAYIESPAEKKDVQLLMGSNDEGKVWLNGKEVVKFNSPRALAKDSSKAAGLTLTAGTNVLVFKVINETNNWQGCLRLIDKDNKPLSDVKVKTAP
jgi:mono/diheme cytochrome c family protein